MSEPDQLTAKLLAHARERGSLQADVVEALDRLDPASLGADEVRLAFWLNLYNALVLAELARQPRSGSLLRHRGLFGLELSRVGGREHSLDLIEHAILRRNARPPYRLRRLVADDDPRLAGAPSELDPRVHFALNCGAVSSPPIRAYEAATVAADLDRATDAYIGAEAVIDRERGRVALPSLLRLYATDFGGRARAVRFGLERLSGDDAAWAAQARPRTGWRRFDWTLR